MDYSSQPSFSRRRRWSITVSVLVSIGAMLAVVIMANYLAARHYWRIPASLKAGTELSAFSKRVLAGITNEVKVVVYFDQQESLFASVWGLLKEYRFANSKISLEAVDYLTEPAAAQLAKAKYRLGARTDKNLVIFDVAGRTPRIVHESELSDLDIQPLVTGQSQEVRRTHFRGELMFTSALMGVLNARQPKAYFLEGHGEHDAESDNRQAGYSQFATLLRQNNVAWQSLTNLIGDRDVPADCQLLIVPGPLKPLLPDELERIERYLKQGGRLLVLFNQQSLGRPTGLEKLLAGWGVSVGENVVVDTKNTDRAGNLVISHISSHPIVKPLYDSSGLYLTLPRSVVKASSVAASADAPQVEALATTSPDGRVLTDIRQGVGHPTAQDYVGVVPLIAAVEKGNLRGVTAERGLTRIVVAGDSTFLSNESIQVLANYDFAHHAVNWLLARNELLSNLGPRPIREYVLTLTQGQLTTLRWSLLLGFPGTVLLLGGLVWFRRRH